jgi:hypothetical protein
MGDVVAFRRGRLTGFIPDDLGVAETEARKRRQDVPVLMVPVAVADLLAFAKTGAPPEPDAEPC